MDIMATDQEKRVTSGGFRMAIDCKYDDADIFSEGLAPVKLGNNWGYIDKTGKEVVPCRYEDASNFSEGLAGVKIGGNGA